MNKYAVISTLFITLFTQPLFAIGEDVKKGVTEQLKETVLNKVAENQKADKEESKIKPDYFLSYGFSSRKAPVITISSGGEVVYEDPKFQRVSFLKQMEDWSLGIAVDYDSNTQDISSLVGTFGGKDWYVVIEHAKLNGKIELTSGGEIPFVDNKYYDVKFLKYKENKEHPEKSVGLGIQYFNYERPSVVNKDLQVYFDPRMNVTFIGLVLEMDSVKRKLLRGIKLKKHDWYFYNTTSWGVSSIKFSDDSRTDLTTLAKPDDDSYLGLGMMGEYELGYVYSFNAWSIKGALKIGYAAQLENPYLSFKSLDSTDRPPKETFFTHGPQITLLGAF